MSVDFQKLQDEVSETRQLMLTLVARLNEPEQSKQTADLLTVSQAAELLNLTAATVYGMVYEKRIPFMKPGGRLYFNRDELLAWVNNSRKTTTEELDEQARQLVSARLNRRKQAKVRKGGSAHV